MASLTLRIITPERIAFDEPVDAVSLPATGGSAGILPRHAHMITALDPGVLRYTAGGKSHELFVGGGFAEVQGDTVRVLSSVGERPEEIDEERALAAEKRARERLTLRSKSADAFDALRAELALQRALMRQRVKRGRS
jgi:F-type H+-transporting ATPase subunit epsilon